MAIKLDELTPRLMELAKFDIRVSESISATRLVDFLKRLFDAHPSLIPERFDPFQPVRTKYTPAAFDQLVRHEDIDRSLMMMGKKRAYSLHRGRSGDGEEFWIFDFDLKQIPMTVIAETADFVTLLPNSIAALHVVSAKEMEYCKAMRLGEEGKGGYRFSCLYPHKLAAGLPTLAWRTYFGPMYIRHFGKERLLSAPAFAVKEVHPDVISIQLSESIQQIDTDWETFHATRQRVIEHLGADSFQRVRGPGDPPPRDQFDRGGIPGTSIPPELRELRRQQEEWIERERQPMPPPLEDMSDLAKNPKRFRVVKIKTGKKQTDLVVVDTYREEMIGFADPAMRDFYVKELLDAGAEYKEIV